MVEIKEGAGEILEKMAATFKERAKVYKGNRAIAANILKSMFPNGVTLVTEKDHERFHILALVAVKLSRYCINWSVGGHKDSIHDAAVYCAILESIDEMIAKEQIK